MTDPLLSVRDVRAFYDRTPALHGVDLEIEPAEVVGVIGANGAGKTSLMKAIAGIDVRTTGSIAWAGRRIESLAGHRRVPLGISLVAQSRELFPNLTVAQNLGVATYRYRRDKARIEANRASVLEMFPALDARLGTDVGHLSGGEQQMVAIGRAMMTEPRLLMMDEPSTGLSPSLVQLVMDKISVLRAAGTAVVVVEQAIDVLLKSVDRVVVMENGRISDSRPVSEIDRDDVQASYMGTD